MLVPVLGPLRARQRRGLRAGSLALTWAAIQAVVAAALRPIYTAPTIDAAESELLAFADSPLGRHYPATVATWENAWQRITGVPGLPARAAPQHLHHG